MGIGTAIVALSIAAASFVIALVVSNRYRDIDTPEDQIPGDIDATGQAEGAVIPLVYGYNYISGNTIYFKSDRSNLTHAEFWIWQTICLGYVGNWEYFEEDGSFLLYTDEKHSREGFIPGSHPGATYTPIDLILNRGDGQYQTKSVPFPRPPWASLGLLTQSERDNFRYVRTGMPGVVSVIIQDRLPEGVRNIPHYKYYVERILNTGLPKENVKYPIVHRRAVGNNPAAVIYDLLTNDQYGLSVDTSEINWQSFVTASEDLYLRALSFVIKEPTSVMEIVRKIQAWADCYLMKNRENEYILKVFKDSDADSPRATIIDNDFIEFTFDRKSWDDTYNAFTGNYLAIEENFSVGFNEWVRRTRRTVTIKNEANIRLTGNIREKVVDLTCFTHETTTRERLMEIMKKESYPYATAKMVTNMEFSYLNKGDVITIDSDEYNTQAPFRILSIDFKEVDKNRIGFNLLQMRETISSAVENQPVEPVAPGLPTETTALAVSPPCLENVTFPPFSAISNQLTRSFVNDADSVVHWGINQLQMGMLTYGTDYTVINHNRIKLDETIYADDIINNASGLLNVDVYEKGCPGVES